MTGIRRQVDTIGGGFAVSRWTRRFWSDDEKRRIVALSYAPGFGALGHDQEHLFQ